MKAYAIPLALLLWAASLVWVGYDQYRRGFTAGTNATLVAQGDADSVARSDAEARQGAAAAAGNAMRAQLDVTLPALEVRSDDTREKIRTIYLAQPAGDAALCRRPDGVQAQLDEAVARANAAARGDLRPGAPAQAATEGAGAP